MKKQIEVTKKSTEFIEVEIPSFFKRFSISVSITDHSIIQVWPDNALISFTPASDERYSAKIAELMNDKPHHQNITKQEFDTAFNNTIKCLTEQYQLSMSMMDPNAQAAPAKQEAIQQQAEGQEVAATESAAQDTAMEVTESAEATEE
jgi:hypothetical protein